MTPERHRRKSELFLRVIDLDPAAREAILAQECADDPELRCEIERLIALDQEADFLEQPALGTEFDLSGVPASAGRPKTGDAPTPPCKEIGNYRIFGVLGEGGMGVVYRAEQINPQRPVALKVLRGAATDRDTVRRFELEAQVLGRLQHPNIAHVYEAGSFQHPASGRDQPFLAMELVDGKPLPNYVRDNTLRINSRLELMLQICDAVEHAHQRGVIHRDLKPANILVQPSGQVKVLDFGIARVTAEDWQVTLVTNKGQLLGTLAYMSPEQFEMDSADIDTRADVYALGVVLYELLTGTLPFDVHGKSIAQALETLRDAQPKPLATTNRALRGDLSVIANKALERDRNQRYASVSDLSADLRRYLAGEPIAARPHTTWYHLRTFARRNRAIVGATAAVVIVLVAGLAGTLWQLAETQRAHRETEQARAEAVTARDQERQRSRELELVTDFQAAILTGIDVHRMGLQLRDDLIEEFRTIHAMASERAGRMDRDSLSSPVYDISPDAPHSIMLTPEEFERSLAGMDFTTTAQRGLQRNIFDRALESIDRDFHDQPLVQARLLQSIADAQEALDLFEQAVHTQQRALVIRRELLGNDHPDTLTSILAAGYLLVGAGEYAEAEAHYREALDGRRRVLGEGHPDTLLVKRRLANLYRMTGQPERSLEYGQAALHGLQRTLGEDDQRLIDALHTMAPLKHGIGKFDDALEYNRRALEGRMRILGEDHPETLISMNNMGVILMSLDRIEDAMPYLDAALEGRQRVLGRDHRLTIQSKANLARGLAALGAYDDAERLTRDVLDQHLRMFGEQHHHTLNTMNSLSEILLDAGRLNDAAEHVAYTLEIHRAARGDSHPETLRAALAKTRLLRESGKPEEALACHDNIMAAAEASLGSQHPLRNFMLAEHALTLAAMERFDEAEPLILEAHQMIAEAYGHDHKQSRQMAGQVADFYMKWHQHDASAMIDERLMEWRARKGEH